MDDYFDDEEGEWYPYQPAMTQEPPDYYEWKVDRQTSAWGTGEKEIYEQAKQMGIALDGWSLWNTAVKLGDSAPLLRIQLSTLAYYDDLIAAIDENRPQRDFHPINDNTTGRLLTRDFKPTPRSAPAA